MPKKRKPKHDRADPPQFAVGETVLFRGEAKVIASIGGLDTGNRPRYTMVGVRGWYSETYIQKMKRD